MAKKFKYQRRTKAALDKRRRQRYEEDIPLHFICPDINDPRPLREIINDDIPWERWEKEKRKRKK